MFSQILDLPFYHQINFLLLAGSGLLVFLFCLAPHKTPATYPISTTEQRLTLFYIAATTLIYTMGMLAAPEPQEPSGPHSPADQLFAILFPVLLYAPLLVCYVMRSRLRFRLQMRHVGAAFLALLAVYACSILMESSGLLQALQAATDSPPEQKSITLLKTKPLSEVLHIVISAIIIAPIIEELFFRGYIFRILCNKTGVITAAVLSGLFFGAIHLSLIQTCVLTCFGVIQCLLYHKTQSLIYPMLMHSVFNTIAVACVFFF